MNKTHRLVGVLALSALSVILWAGINPGAGENVLKGVLPAGFAQPLLFAHGLMIGFLVLLFVHFARKLMLPGIDLVALIKSGDLASAVSAVAVAIVELGIVLAFLIPSLHADELSPMARQYAPILARELKYVLPDHPAPHAVLGLAEQESCPKCWNPRSSLKTAREEGAGIPQLLTREQNYPLS